MLCQDEENGEDAVAVGDEDTTEGDPTDDEAPTSGGMADSQIGTRSWRPLF